MKALIKFNSLFEFLEYFDTEEKCILFLQKQRWPNGAVSPYDATSKVYVCSEFRFKCKNTGLFFTVRTGTMFEHSKLPLRKWFVSIYLVLVGKKGISSVQLAKEISVTQKTAWFLLQRLRNALQIPKEKQMEGVIEADETFVGGKNKNRHADKKVKNSQGRSFKDKTPVFGMVSRGKKGDHPKEVRLFVVESTQKGHIQPIILDQVKKGATFYSDEWSAYKGLNARYNHSVIDHGKRIYVDQDNPEIHTNTIEGFWGIFKRGIVGVYQMASRRHLQLYCNEFAFRYNHLESTLTEMFINVFKTVEHPLTYAQLIGMK